MKWSWTWGGGGAGSYAEMLASMPAGTLDCAVSEKRREVACATRELRRMEKELAARKVAA